MKKLFSALLLALALAASPAFASIPAQPVPWTFWGTQPNQPSTNWPTATQATSRLWSCNNGAGEWLNIETANGVYFWSALDTCVSTLRQRGANIIFTFGGVPGWANGNAGSVAPPTSNSTISAFATAVATRYAGKINEYECWNEMNGAWWSGTATQMAAVCQAIQSAIAAADPNAKMMTPSVTGPSGPQFMQQYLAAGGGAYASIFNIHGYAQETTPSDPPEQTAQICQDYRALAVQFGLSNYELWVDEGGWGDGTVINTPNLQEAYGSIYPLLLASCGVSRQLWYQYDQGSGGSVWGEQWNGTSLTPGGQAYFTTQSMLNGATFVQLVARVANANGIRNATGSGAIPGSPGTLPTNWSSYLPDSGFGIATSVVGSGVENGIPYVDIQVSGTATSGAAGYEQFFPETSSQIAGTLGQQWNACANLKVVGGSMINAAVVLEFDEYSATDYLASDGFLSVYPTAAPLNLAQFCTAGKTTNSSVAFVSPLISVSYSVGQAINVTLRIGAPSMDSGSIWSGTFTKAGNYQAKVLWDSAGGPTSYAPPSWCQYVTNYAGTKTAVTGTIALTNVPQFCSNQ